MVKFFKNFYNQLQSPSIPFHIRIFLFILSLGLIFEPLLFVLNLLLHFESRFYMEIAILSMMFLNFKMLTMLLNNLKYYALFTYIFLVMLLLITLFQYLIDERALSALIYLQIVPIFSVMFIPLLRAIIINTLFFGLVFTLNYFHIPLVTIDSFVFMDFSIVTMIMSLGIYSFVSHSHQMHNDLTIQLHTDTLTKCASRLYFLKRANQQLEHFKRENIPFSIVMLDIDYFKKINDTYGHHKGDEILISLTQYIQETLRPYDILGRYEGEEFLILLPKTTKDEACIVAQKLCNILPQKIILPNNKGVTSSFGITSASSQDTLDILLHRCDEALYAAKDAGRNQIKFQEKKEN
jgi:diguanylate cyclase